MKRAATLDLFSDLKGGPNTHLFLREAERNSQESERMARRLTKLAHSPQFTKTVRLAAHDFAVRINFCAMNLHGWKCEVPLCPRCARRLAISYRKRASYLFQRPQLALLTLTSIHDDLKRGLAIITRAFSSLRRLVVWRRAVEGAVGSIEVEPCRDDDPRWNVHFHLVVSLLQEIEIALINQKWTALLGAEGSFGTIDVQYVGAGDFAACSDEDDDG